MKPVWDLKDEVLDNNQVFGHKAQSLNLPWESQCAPDILHQYLNLAQFAPILRIVLCDNLSGEI